MFARCVATVFASLLVTLAVASPEYYAPQGSTAPAVSRLKLTRGIWKAHVAPSPLGSATLATNSAATPSRRSVTYLCFPLRSDILILGLFRPGRWSLGSSGNQRPRRDRPRVCPFIRSSVFLSHLYLLVASPATPLPASVD